MLPVLRSYIAERWITVESTIDHMWLRLGIENDCSSSTIAEDFQKGIISEKKE